MKKRIICPFDEKNLSTDLISEVLDGIGATFEEDGVRWCGFLKSEEGELTGFCIEPNLNILTIFLCGNERVARLIVDSFVKDTEEMCLQVDVDDSFFNDGEVDLKYYWVVED